MKPFANMEKIETTKHVGTPYPPRSDEDEPPQSVIHAPAGFGRFVSSVQKERSTAKS
jgi:hypothetical protein